MTARARHQSRPRWPRRTAAELRTVPQCSGVDKKGARKEGGKPPKTPEKISSWTWFSGKIIKIVGTRSHVLCEQRSPRPLKLDLGVLLLKGQIGRVEKRRGEGKRIRERNGSRPLLQFTFLTTPLPGRKACFLWAAARGVCRNAG